MLKAIELHGFKSFADRTRLEFGEGISAVVGPNGSGKSNIVDAIKWVLGEQSVKKLRGSEMTDVIFSGSAGRQPLGAAEVTLSFDNSNRIFDLDTSEVHITRRIYRSGEGEYLVNRFPSRLRDIKDLLGGTGLGTQAYSIIEQGRVESLLQSTSLQRRVIFDEAAGISRLNAKKLEAQKRWERVDQNMIRLADKVNEVENQLKTVKAQAGKAQLYRQYTARLQELRVQSSLVDYRKNAAQKNALLEDLEQLAAAEKEVQELLEQYERSVQEVNRLVEESNEQIGRIEGEIVAVKEKIVSEESGVEFQIEQTQTLDAEIVQHARQLLDLNVRSVDTEELMRKTHDEIRNSKKFHREIEATYQQCLETADTLAKELQESRELCSRHGKELEEKRRAISRISGELKGLQNRAQSLAVSREQGQAKVEQSRLQIEELTGTLAKLQEECDKLSESLLSHKELVEAAKRQKNQHLEQLARLEQELNAHQHRHSAMSERIAVLEELLSKHEGLSPGVREVMRHARNPESPFRFVHGLVADLFRVEVESAPLMELALGLSAQHIVVSPEKELFRHIERNSSQFPGRVGFIWLDPNPHEFPEMFGEDFSRRPGVLGRADQFVQADPQYSHLAKRLLGRTWIVQNIAVAKALYQESDDRTNFLTVRGEYLTADGTIIVGPAAGNSGVIARRSELRTLGEQLLLIESQIRDLEIKITVHKNQLAEDEQELENHVKNHQDAAKNLDAGRNALKSTQERIAHFSSQHEQLQRETDLLREQHERAQADLEETDREKTERENVVAQIEQDLGRLTRELEEAERQNREHTKKTTNAKIELAKSEERLDFLKDRVRQFEDHQLERQHLLDEHQKRIRLLGNRKEQALLAALKHESLIALLYVKKETFALSTKSLYENRAEAMAKRSLAQGELKKTQQEGNRLRGKVHAKQMELERIEQEQKVLIDRMKEDYHIDLEEYEEQEAGGRRQKAGEDNDTPGIIPITQTGPIGAAIGDLSDEEVAREIETLRARIQKLGGVNLDAIETLEELETRYTTLSNHYNDFLSAKKATAKIIEKINVDSQRLFEETFEGVRLHFQQLFQQLFGGGFADLKLEDETNVLECGVDIVARPPGKELKSVSLLSGGEKTLTCVALLLAFFRFKPNPVCILDEVDAALDEGNIDRFTQMLSGFKAQTQFLLITHSKKTMTCASTLYGVTMQESGVSKPISVRFVDVGENGEILDTAM
ncbi:MAG: chromosome segregation protein SMC, partial [Planctomycetaceae bacterium]|nr:chromosome segregation protein SMC [Planctomycetaceae bacterium]